mgnify:CR=1 FL=1
MSSIALQILEANADSLIHSVTLWNLESRGLIGDFQKSEGSRFVSLVGLIAKFKELFMKCGDFQITACMLSGHGVS